MHSSSRRRGPWLCSELSPLERDDCRLSSTTKRSDYSTFTTKTPTSSVEEEKPFWKDVLSHFLAVSTGVCTQHHRSRKQTAWWKTTALLLFFGTAGTFFHRESGGDFFDQTPDFEWDHNVYNPKLHQVSNQGAVLDEDLARLDELNAPRNLLLAQVAGCSQLGSLAEISSRPNRASARQWGRDYVFVQSQSTSVSKACFEKALVLKQIMDKQKRAAFLSVHLQYDAVLLLPPDAIITDLDYDLLQLIPSENLLSIAGWQKDDIGPSGYQADVVFFNLKHPLASAVSDAWWELVRPSEVTCGAGNDLQLLLDAIQTVIDDDDQRLASLIFTLDEMDHGFIGKDSSRVIREIFPSVPSSKTASLIANLADSKYKLQTTADSVCYRYYPRCEVL